MLVICTIMDTHTECNMSIYKVIHEGVHVTTVTGKKKYTETDIGNILTTIYEHYSEVVKWI